MKNRLLHVLGIHQGVRLFPRVAYTSNTTDTS
jgi:hypothetical protein